MDKVISLQKQGKCNMRKLKRIRDGKVFDCTILVDATTTFVVYFENDAWVDEDLEHFVPAIPGKDY